MPTESSMAPLVGVVMGSKSDWETMRHCSELLTELGIPHESKVVSAHRTPERLFRYGREAEGRGLEVVIAGAGGAAHLPGMLAAITMLAGSGSAGREQGTPRPGFALVDRANATWSAGRNARHRSFRRGQRGNPGGGDSGTQASRNSSSPAPVSASADGCCRRGAGMMVSTGHSGAPRSGVLYPPASLGVVGSGQLGRMFIQAAQRMGYRAGVLAAADDDPAAQVAHWSVIGASDELAVLREFRAKAEAVTVEFENVSAAALRWLARDRIVRPGWQTAWICSESAA